jgi:hypothetical protein
MRPGPNGSRLRVPGVSRLRAFSRPAGGGDPEPDPHAIVSITDNGVGIPRVQTAGDISGLLSESPNVVITDTANELYNGGPFTTEYQTANTFDLTGIEYLGESSGGIWDFP